MNFMNYVIGEEERAPVKLGYGVDPGARLKVFSSKNGSVFVPPGVNRDRLKVLYVCPGDHPLEQALHVHFRDRWVGGEWFDLHPSEAPRLVREAVAEILSARRDGRTHTAHLYEVIAHDLRRRIHSGEMPPGALLPSEVDLIRQFSAARGTVREAISRLRNEGLIHTARGRGSYVAPGTALFGAIAAAPNLDALHQLWRRHRAWWTDAHTAAAAARKHQLGQQVAA